MRTATVAALLALALALLPPAAYAASGTTSYRGNPAHDGHAAGADPPARAKLRWSYRLPPYAQPPLAVGNRVFVATHRYADGDPPSRITAIDARSGRRLWERSVSRSHASIAYDSGRILALDESITAFAFDPRSGRRLWRRRLPNHPLSTSRLRSGSIPVAARGLVHFSVYSGVQSYYMITLDARTGATRWIESTPFSDGPPTVAGGRVFHSGSCEDANARVAATGELKWWRGAACGAGGGFPVAYRDSVFVSSGAAQRTRLDAETGEARDVWSSHGAPVLAGNTGVFGTPEGSWRAVDMPTGRTLWTRGRALGIDDVLIAGSTVVVADGKGRLDALELATGRRRWRLAVPERAGPEPRVPWLAASGRHVVVVVGRWAFGYGPS
ncbi:MAG: PQQ-binding-like beta-propeller repeat protein [Actinomycetota bacterium]|nr:PQQ-binding-like beta-propeller repeat protein [Actinomycetota bacterium]